MSEKPTILCIDDRPENLKIRTMLLEQFGCSTIAAADYHSALEVVTQQSVDLLLIDYHLSDGRDGEEIARDVRVMRPDLPLVMLTGDTNIPESARECVDVVLVKGQSDPRILLSTIEKLLPDHGIHPRRKMLFKPPESNAS